MKSPNFIRQNYIWTAVKVIAALYQVSATYRVFKENLLSAGRSYNGAVIDSVFAILLIDALFISILYFLESSEISTFEKTPLVLVGLALTAAIVIIGVSDEGTTAWMPRVGVIGLIGVDVFRWGSDVGRNIFSSIQYRHSRPYLEEKIRNEEVIARRKAMKDARKEALEILYPEFIEVQIERERRNLGILPEVTTQDLIVKEQEPANDNVVVLDNGSYGWVDPTTGELNVQTTTGKPYSERGANLAFNRALKKVESEPAW